MGAINMASQILYQLDILGLGMLVPIIMFIIGITIASLRKEEDWGIIIGILSWGLGILVFPTTNLGKPLLLLGMGGVSKSFFDLLGKMPKKTLWNLMVISIMLKVVISIGVIGYGENYLIYSENNPYFTDKATAGIAAKIDEWKSIHYVETGICGAGNETCVSQLEKGVLDYTAYDQITSILNIAGYLVKLRKLLAMSISLPLYLTINIIPMVENTILKALIYLLGVVLDFAVLVGILRFIFNKRGE